MEEIRLSQTQPFSLTGSATGESSDTPILALAATNELVIADQVLGIRREHRKDVGCIIKGKRKALDTSYSTVTTGLLEQSSQVAEDHRLLCERVDAQQRDNKALHHELDTFKAFITHTLS